MSRWDLRLRDIYSPDEPGFTTAFPNALVSELERQRQIKNAAREERNRLSTTPGVTFEAPTHAVTTPLPQAIAVMPKPQYDHATGKMTGLVDANAGKSGIYAAGTPRPTVSASESPLDQALAALNPQYNEIALPDGSKAYFDPNYQARTELQNKALIGRQSRYEAGQTLNAERSRAAEEYAGLLQANGPDTRLGKRLRTITAEMWAANPALRDDIIKQGNQPSPEEAEQTRLRLQDDNQRALMDRLAATLAANRNNLSIRLDTQRGISAAANETRRTISEAANASREKVAGMPARSRAADKDDILGTITEEMGADNPKAAAANPRTYYQNIARDPAFKGQPAHVVRAEAVRRRTLDLVRQNPDITTEELEEALQGEGFI